MSSHRGPALVALALSVVIDSQGAAQAQAATLSQPAGPQYEAGAVYRFLFGREYRGLWTAPITVPVLDLASFAGGLRPVGRTGGQQTRTLRLRNPEGREFFFRSIDKDPSGALPPELRGTVAGEVVRDQTSSALPGGPLVAARLLAAAGVLHDETRLVILPDDSLLGEFRPQFAGVIGTLEQAVGGPGGAHWGGALEIIDSDTLDARVRAGPDDRVDVRAFLRARLMDLLMGDWDRHRDQWRWARLTADEPRSWHPVPLDRDQAFVKYDGFLLALGRQVTPQLTNFGSAYPEVVGATWNGRDLDRRHLVGLERPVWEAVAGELSAVLTNAVIDSAVALLPPPHDRMVGSWLAAALRRRRDHLPEAAAQYYRLLAREVDVHGTDQGELAEVTGMEDGGVTLKLAPRQPEGSEPYFVRRFLPEETREVRLFLEGGADSAVTRGVGGGITVRILAEGDDDALVDSLPGGRDRFYNSDAGDSRTAGLRSAVDRRRWAPPPNPNPRALPPRDWGRRWQWSLWSSFGPDLGLFVGAGRTLTTYGFRKLPFASRHRLRAGFATGPGSYRAEYRGEFRRENSGLAAELLLRASGIEVIRFHGFGNETRATGSNEFYRVTQDEYRIAPSLQVPVFTRLTLTVGPTLTYVSTDHRPSRYLATLSPYGAGNFGELGARAALRFDGRDRATAATRGLSLELAGAVHPAWWDVREAFGELAGETRVFLSPSLPLEPTVAFRAGGRKLWGAYPYFEAAFIGGSSTVRLGRENRFAGDASAYGSAELRLRLGRSFIVVPADIGVFGLADVGRVWLDGESSDRWHEALGGGIWVGFLSRANTLSVAVAASDERTGVYVQAGFGF
jgi:hypothetical protein